MSFDGYEFKNYILHALEDLQFKSLTPVQKEVLNAIHMNKNILAKSKTGSGKTHAFLLPIFEALNEENHSVFATIISPTKELAMQTYKMAQHIASFSGKRIDIKIFSGGTDRLKEIEKLKSTMPQIVIGTPGKIKDLAITENALKIYTSKFFIVDEMDMALDGGYEEDLDEISKILVNSKMMFFSATMEDRVLHFAKKYLSSPHMIEIKDTNDAQIEHIWIPLKHKNRIEMLLNLLNTIQPYLAIVFANTKERVIEVGKELSSRGYFVGLMHGDLTPRERKRVLNDCKALKYQYLVATDLAARGLDIEGVTHIINYELPYNYEFYLHRSGRTGRMHRDGVVYSFYEDVDDTYLDNLAKKKISPNYYEMKNGELIPYKGRATRTARIKPKTDYQKKAAKFVPKPKKVSPGYKKKMQEKIDDIATRLKKNDQKKKRRAK
ncbi:MAG: DEAD/DEAH box helicase [Anaeroplasma bactoclasticum]|nr:DEAD/DEAH box helicase [Anaeroplasma bactoclasticum]MCM1557522.1 DEAD/DEAH box helicase [Anaeroplasma bactoclasticum]